MTSLDLICWVIVAGLGAVGLTTILRNAPVIRQLVLEAKKPWACNVCMPLYTTALVLSAPLSWTADWRYAAAYPAAYAVAYLVLEKLSRPPPGPPELPEEFLVEDDTD